MQFSFGFVAALATFALAAPAAEVRGENALIPKSALAGGSGDGTWYDTGLGACGVSCNKAFKYPATLLTLDSVHQQR